MNLKHFLTHLEASALKVTNPAMSNKVQLREWWWMMVEAVTEELFGYENGDVICILTSRNKHPRIGKNPGYAISDHFGGESKKRWVNIVASSALALLAKPFNVSSRPVNKKRFLLRWLSYNEGKCKYVTIWLMLINFFQGIPLPCWITGSPWISGTS